MPKLAEDQSLRQREDVKDSLRLREKIEERQTEPENNLHLMRIKTITIEINIIT